MNTELRQSLLAELASIERQLQDPTLSNMDRDRLDQVWEDTHDRLDDLDGLFIAIPPVDDNLWRGASDFFADQPPTPPPSSPVRIALPSPPPLLSPPPVEDRGVYAPPPPRAWEPDEEDIARANAYEDDREGCAHCPGCHYCQEDSYDGEGEV